MVGTVQKVSIGVIAPFSFYPKFIGRNMVIKISTDTAFAAPIMVIETKLASDYATTENT